MSRTRADGLREPTSQAQLAVMRSFVRDGAADRPGVYRMLSSSGEVVYVGKSKQIRTRLLKQLRPRFNVAMKRDGTHYAFIKITRPPAPKLAVVRGASTDDASIYYGPFVGAQRMEDALRELSDVLMLRDCRSDQKMHFSDQQELFQIAARTPGCIRYEIGKCLGPCVGGCSVSQYDARVTLARAFLDGASDGPIEVLRRTMEEASEQLQFERAAAFRDKLNRLEVLREQFGRLRFAVETLSFVYTVPGFEGNDRVYVVKRGVVRAEAAKPRSKAQRTRLQQLVDGIFANGDPPSAAVPTHEIDELLLLSSWFRRFPDEMNRTMPVS